MIPEKTVICLSTIDWHYAKQRHQLIMEYLAGQGIRVLFVEHLGFARQNIRDIGNIVSRLVRACRGHRNDRAAGTLPQNLHVITPLVLPPSNRLFDLLNKYFFLALLARKLRRRCAGRPLVWTYLATSTAVNLIARLDPSRIVYDCVYDALRHPSAPPRIGETERRLLARADIVITDARYFLREKRKLHPRVHQVPPGVDFEHFNRPSPTARQVLSDITSVRRPRIVFFGCIGKEQNRIDLPLMEYIARQQPGWSLVFIGPVVDMTLPRPLRDLPNLHWLGFKPYELLPRYLAECDAILFPYLLNDFTESVLPAKVFEALATGKPVVSTALPELVPLSEHIAIARDGRECVALLARALATDGEAAREKRRRCAQENTWASRFKTIEEILAKPL